MAVGILFCVGLIGAQFVSIGTSDSGEPDGAAQEAAIERIQPVAKVMVVGAATTTEAPVAEAEAVEAEPAQAPAAEPVAAAQPEAEAPAAAPAVAAGGETTYKQVCFVCHDSGVLEAPKLGDKAAWEPRLATGVDALVASVINGKGNMPPRAGNVALSDETIRVAVEYMVGKAQ